MRNFFSAWGILSGSKGSFLESTCLPSNPSKSDSIQPSHRGARPRLLQKGTKPCPQDQRREGKDDRKYSRLLITSPGNGLGERKNYRVSQLLSKGLLSLR